MTAHAATTDTKAAAEAPACGAPHARLSWAILIAALWATAGHGLFLVAQLVMIYGVPDVEQAGGPAQAALNGCFAAAIPVAVVAVLLRRRLLALPPFALSLLATLAAAAAVTGFALYFATVAK